MKNKDILKYAFFRKEVIEFDKANVSIAANSLQYGGLVFGGIRGYKVDENNYKIFRLYDHYKRLMDANKIMAFGYDISYEDFKNIIHKLIKYNTPKGNFYIRPFIFCDQEIMGPKLNKLTFDLAIYMQNLDDYVNKESGIRFMTSSFRKYNDSAISTKAKVGGAYVNSMLATHQANICGFDEAILLNDEGHVTEASVANLLLVRNNQILLPIFTDGSLEGITVRSAIDILKYHNFKVLVRNIDRSTLYTADELIVTGTAMQVFYGQEVDGRKITHGDNPGPITTLIQEEMQKIIDLKHENPDFINWLTLFKI